MYYSGAGGAGYATDMLRCLGAANIQIQIKHSNKSPNTNETHKKTHLQRVFLPINICKGLSKEKYWRLLGGESGRAVEPTYQFIIEF